MHDQTQNKKISSGIFNGVYRDPSSPTYPFFKQQKGFASAFYQNGLEYNTTNNNSGELKITKFDQTNRILSGTFFFTGTNISTGEKVNITDGRFDVRY